MKKRKKRSLLSKGFRRITLVVVVAIDFSLQFLDTFTLLFQLLVKAIPLTQQLDRNTGQL